MKPFERTHVEDPCWDRKKCEEAKVAEGSCYELITFPHSLSLPLYSLEDRGRGVRDERVKVNLEKQGVVDQRNCLFVSCYNKLN